MQTHFSAAQLEEPATRASEAILRNCVHCGFCTATCPTYLLEGDELDSPRGRIYLIKDMLENGRPATADVVRHIDRCLSCLGCMTTCPSGVHYQHLVDHARAYIEENFRRPLADRLLRAAIAWTLPHPGRFRAALALGRLARPFAALLPRRLRHALSLLPGETGAPLRTGVYPAQGAVKKRVALLAGCVQQPIAPQINAATVRLLTRLGCEVTVAAEAGCCGALEHHLGRRGAALAAARRNIAAWHGFDAVVVNASGCGTQVKDYGFMLRDDPAWAMRAAEIASRARDVTELVAELGISAALADVRFAQRAPPPLVVAYHSACSLTHGQRVVAQPRALLREAGFDVREIAEGHLCCGSAGSYNILQPALAERLRARKARNVAATGADVLAAGNIGCLVQIAGAVAMPAVHTVELLDWATGGPKPEGLP
jgi:glycolate oxidase iron-sulfur subunit